MTFREHATRAVDYSIGAALVGTILFPVLVFGSFGPGLGTEPPDRVTEQCRVLLFVYCAPATYPVALLHAMGINFGLVDWVVSCVVVSAFWGTLVYVIVFAIGWLLRAWKASLRDGTTI